MNWSNQSPECLWACLLVLGFVVDVGEAALSTVLSVEVRCHEDTGAAFLAGALTAQTGDLAILINLVEFEDSKLELLLLALLGATTQPEHQVEGGLLLDVVVRQGAAIFQLLAGEDQTLLIRRDALFVLNFGLYVFDSVTGFHLEGDGFPRQCFHENLHLE